MAGIPCIKCTTANGMINPLAANLSRTCSPNGTAVHMAIITVVISLVAGPFFGGVLAIGILHEQVGEVLFNGTLV